MEEQRQTINVSIDTGARQMSLMSIGQERNWAIAILLWIVTISIYGWVYLFKVYEEAKRFVTVKNPTISVTSGGAAVGYLFIPIFGFIWIIMLLFKTPGLISKMNKARGVNSEGWAWLGLLNLIPLVGFIAVFIITQIKINEIWREEREKLVGSPQNAQVPQLEGSQIQQASSHATPKSNFSKSSPFLYVGATVAAFLVLLVIFTAYRKYSSLHENQIAKVRVKDGLILRSEPSRNGSKILTIPTDANVEVISTDGPEETISDIKGKWYKLNYSGKSGWGFGGFLDMK